MMASKLPSLPCLELGIASAAQETQVRSGDRHFVALRQDGEALLAVMDGLGHGLEAEAAATAAVAALEQQKEGTAVQLVTACHEALRRTRGVVMSLALISAATGELTWVGVGNVEGALVRASPSASPRRESLLTRSGVVGYRLPPLRASTLPLFREDVLFFTTDGVDRAFLEACPLLLPAQGLAEHVLAGWRRPSDDALILVARYLGAPT